MNQLVVKITSSIAILRAVNGTLKIPRASAHVSSTKALNGMGLSRRTQHSQIVGLIGANDVPKITVQNRHLKVR